MMMSFCKKSVHSLALTNTKDNGTAPPPHASSSPSRHRHIVTNSTTGLGLFTASTGIQKPANVVESAAIQSPPPPYCPPTTTLMPTAAATATIDDLPCGVRKDAGGIGFDEVGGSADGLKSCTESLGFESSDERTVDDEFDEIISYQRRLKKTEAERRKTKRFPPPISSLSQDGKPTFFLRSVREDGRLELRRVKFNQSEALLVSRQDGRLRLHLISNNDDQGTQEKSDQEDKAGDTVTEEEKEEKRVIEWKFPVTTNSGGGDGSRRCYGPSVQQQHHAAALFVWRQPYVSST